MKVLYDIFKELLLDRLEIIPDYKLTASKLSHLLTICYQPFFAEKTLAELKNQYSLDFDEKYDKLRVDYYLPHFKLGIEFDGEQHIKNVDYFGGESAYLKRKQYDTKKNQFFADNQLRLLRLSYNSTTKDLLQALRLLLSEDHTYVEVNPNHLLSSLSTFEDFDDFELEDELTFDDLDYKDIDLDDLINVPVPLTHKQYGGNMSYRDFVKKFTNYFGLTTGVISASKLNPTVKDLVSNQKTYTVWKYLQ